jgi:microcin C transport system substrate-binding protein
MISFHLALSSNALSASLPKDLSWQTQTEFESIAAKEAQAGGTVTDFLLAFPLTLRQVGPDSNGGFRAALDANDLSLTTIHPNQDVYIPILATHWAFSKDKKTVFYKLNPKARWSDGKPVTAQDFVYTREFMTSPHIIAPWYNEYYSKEISGVVAYKDSDGTEIVGITLPQAKPDMLFYTNLKPMPRHFYKLDQNFVKDYNWKIAPNTGPYKITKLRKGKYVTFERKQDWWADDLSWFKHRFNVKRVKFKVIRDMNVAFENLKKGNIDYMSIPFPDYWHEKTKDQAFTNGYIHKMQAYNDAPRSDYVMVLNQSIDIFKDKNVRLAFHHAMNVDKVINQVLRGDYNRLQGISRGYGKYTNESIKARPFDIKKAGELLDKAGWKSRNGDGIRIKNGRTLSATISFGQANISPRLVVLKEEAKKVGIELKLKQMDPAALWKSYLEKQHEIAFVSWGTGYRPQYWGMYHSANANKTQTNNFSNTALPQLDKHIESYRSSTDEKERIKHAHAIQQIIHDEATQIPLFEVPYFRLAYWGWIKFPNPPSTRLTDGFEHFDPSTGGTHWIDKKTKKDIQNAKRSRKKLAPVTRIERTYEKVMSKS